MLVLYGEVLYGGKVFSTCLFGNNRYAIHMHAYPMLGLENAIELTCNTPYKLPQRGLPVLPSRFGAFDVGEGP